MNKFPFIQSRRNNELDISLQFSLGSPIAQLKRLQQILRAVGVHVKSVGILMMGAMCAYDVHNETVKSIDIGCPNLKKFYAAGLSLHKKQFNDTTMKLFFGRLEEIILQMCQVEGLNTFADCKKLKEWRQEIFYGFNGKCLNFNFPELRYINFSKVDEIDNQHLVPFLSKNPQLKSMTLTRCTIDPKILELISKHVPAIEELAFNFRRSLVHRHDMQKNVKHLLKLERLKALNLDCVGVAIGDTLMKMADKNSPLNRVGIFCCPWEKKLIKAFANLKNLKSLHLSNVTGLNDESLGLLTPSLIGLTNLTLKFIKNVTIDGVLTLMAQCQHLTTATLCLKKMTTISTARYNLLLESIKKRPEKIKLTITVWGSKNPLRLSKDLLKENLEYLEIILVERGLNNNTDFDFYCDSADGGYDLVSYTPLGKCCNVN